MQKNVLQLIGSFHQGGSERQAVQLTRLLHEDKTYKVFAACLNRDGILYDEFSKMKLGEVPEYKLTSFYDANMLRQLKSCAKFMRENDIKVIQTHDFYTNIFGMLAGRIAKTPVRIAAKRETGTKDFKQRFMERRAYGFAHKIVSNSEAVKKYLVAGGTPKEKIVTVYNGLDTSRLTPTSEKREVKLKEFGLPIGADTQFITIVANLRSEVKNHKMFLRAAKTVKESFKNVGFVMAGEGELTESLKEFAKDLGLENETHFIGRCSKVADLLSVSNICVLSSFTEGFSNSIIEYMSVAKPVIATNVGGASEAIIEGETGYLVESEDDNQLAKRLLELLNNQEKAVEMGKKGQSIVEDKFSLSAQLDKTLSLYDSQLEKQS